MLHCPYCGTIVKEDEEYCLKCGKQLPDDRYDRLKEFQRFNRFWYFPIFILLLFILTTSMHYLLLQHNTTMAKKVYEQAETSLMDNKFEEAKELFEESLSYKRNFHQADISVQFMNKVLAIQNDLTVASTHLGKGKFQAALVLLNESESSLKNYNGTAVTQLIETIDSTRDTIKIEQLKDELSKDPSIDILKILLWDAEAINNNKADEITTTIRNQIIEYIFSTASSQLNNNQFKDAQIIVKDGLKYAPDSDKLQSLKTTIDKEKTTFETEQQQRIEQAVNLAAEEQEINKNDAIKLVKVNVQSDDQGKLVVKGEVNSVATIPINSILVEYSLYINKNTELVSNKVFIYPDKLYPGETGKFEFTHYDLKEQNKKVKVKVKKMTWYTD